MAKEGSAIFLAILLLWTFACKQDIMDAERAASVFSEFFELVEEDNLEQVDFSLESDGTAIATFKLYGIQLTSKIIKTNSGWALTEIQNRGDDWVPSEHFVKVQGKLVDKFDRVVADTWVTIYELHADEGQMQVSLKVGKGGILLNPNGKTDSQGNFAIIGDRRIWEGSGMFTLGVSYMGSTRYLEDQNNVTIAVEMDENAKKAELGKIKVSY